MDVHWDVHYKILVTTIYNSITELYHWIVVYSGIEMQQARGLFPLLSKLWTIAIDVV